MNPLPSREICNQIVDEMESIEYRHRNTYIYWPHKLLHILVHITQWQVHLILTMFKLIEVYPLASKRLCIMNDSEIRTLCTHFPLVNLQYYAYPNVIERESHGTHIHTDIIDIRYMLTYASHPVLDIVYKAVSRLQLTHGDTHNLFNELQIFRMALRRKADMQRDDANMLLFFASHAPA